MRHKNRGMASQASVSRVKATDGHGGEPYRIAGPQPPSKIIGRTHYQRLGDILDPK